MKIAESLLQKYNLPVPRYTSYPPANHFSDSFTGDNYIDLLKSSNNDDPQNIAFYIHIPFCRKICFYCGCNACPEGKGEMTGQYMKALKREIEIVSAFIGKTRRISQIHYGGGTPNSIDINYIQDLNRFIFSEFSFIDNPEIAIECNPAYLNFEYASQLLDSGFNRFSLGIQDFDDRILKLVNRDPSFLPPADILNYLKSKKPDVSVNFDFIYGLPGQTVTSFANTINKAIDIRPDRLVTFSYAHVPWLKKHQTILEKRGLPGSTEKMNMYITAYDLLKDAGYIPLGLDHFVLPEDDLYHAMKDNKLHRNFQGYCTRRTTGQVYAFGITAISQLGKGYSQNTKDLSTYISSVGNGLLPVERGCTLTRAQMITREIITELMCNKKISLSQIAGKEKITVAELKEITDFREERLEKLSDDRLLEFDGDLLLVTEPGAFFIRNIAALFDSEYQQKKDTYSRNV